MRVQPTADWNEEIDRPAAAAHISTLEMTQAEKRKARERLARRSAFGFGRALEEGK